MEIKSNYIGFTTYNYLYLQTPYELPNLVEDYKYSSGTGYAINAVSTLYRLADWLGTSGAANIMPDYDHVMLHTK